MGRWLAVVTVAAAGILAAAGISGCKKVEPKNIRDVRREGAQRAPRWDAPPSEREQQRRPRFEAEEQESATETQVAEAAKKGMEQQKADEWVEREFKVNDEAEEREEREDRDMPDDADRLQ